MKNIIKQILDGYKTANMWSESVRDRIADELVDELKSVIIKLSIENAELKDMVLENGGDYTETNGLDDD